MAILKNKLPHEFVLGEKYVIPAATEAHDEEGRLVATDGELEVPDAELEALRSSERAAPFFADGAVYVYVPEEVGAESEGGEL